MEQLLVDFSSTVLVLQKGSLHSTLIQFGLQMKLSRLLKMTESCSKILYRQVFVCDSSSEKSAIRRHFIAIYF